MYIFLNILVYMTIARVFGVVFLPAILISQSKFCTAVEVVTGDELQLPSSAFGGAIEGAAVNAKGDVFAADFLGSGAAASSAFGFFNQVEGGTTNVLDLKINPFFTASQEGRAKPPLIAGARFQPDGRLFLTGLGILL